MNSLVVRFNDRLENVENVDREVSIDPIQTIVSTCWRCPLSNKAQQLYIGDFNQLVEIAGNTNQSITMNLRHHYESERFHQGIAPGPPEALPHDKDDPVGDTVRPRNKDGNP